MLKRKEKARGSAPKYTYYCSDGTETEDKTAQNVVAYKADHGTHLTYHIKMYSSKMYNVIDEKDVFYNRHLWQFRTVYEPAFRLYVKFLQTRQVTTLRRAEREAI